MTDKWNDHVENITHAQGEASAIAAVASMFADFGRALDALSPAALGAAAARKQSSLELLALAGGILTQPPQANGTVSAEAFDELLRRAKRLAEGVLSQDESNA